MKISSLPLEGLALIELSVFKDQRGFFAERFNEVKFKEQGLPLHFVQDNHSRSMPGVLRGLHFQLSPAQGKLVGVIRGKIWDVCVDIRSTSSTYGQWFGIELSDENVKVLWIPAGFAHGFCVLGNEPADVLYKVTAGYSPTGESGFHWADPDLAIQWPIQDPIVSARDQNLPPFSTLKR